MGARGILRFLGPKLELPSMSACLQSLFKMSMISTDRSGVLLFYSICNYILQGFLEDIIYKGSEDDIRKCCLPDGTVLLVGHQMATLLIITV